MEKEFIELVNTHYGIVRTKRIIRFCSTSYPFALFNPMAGKISTQQAVQGYLRKPESIN